MLVVLRICFRDGSTVGCIGACFLVPIDGPFHTVVGILIESASGGEDDEGHLSVTEHRQFIGFLEKTIAALTEGHLPIGRVLYPLDLDLPPPHVLVLGIIQPVEFGHLPARDGKGKEGRGEGDLSKKRGYGKKKREKKKGMDSLAWSLSFPSLSL